MTTRLVIVLDVVDVDPTLVDPHEIADELLDEPESLTRGAARFVSAEWQDA